MTRPLLLTIMLLSLAGCQSPEMKSLKQGARWYQRGEYDRAIEISSNVLTTHPTNMYALALRADSFAEKKEYAKALEDYDKAIQFYPSLARLYYHRGVCWYEYAKRGKWYDEEKLMRALADYNKVIELDRKYRAAYINRAAINKMMGNYKPALDDYDIILALTPNDEKAKAERAKILKAIQDGSRPQVRDNPPPEKDQK